MKSPNKISSLELKNLTQCEVEIDGKWSPARPMAHTSLLQRLKYSWLVFKGEADIITWYKQ